MDPRATTIRLPSIPLIFCGLVLDLAAGCGDAGLHSRQSDGPLPPSRADVERNDTQAVGSPDVPLGPDTAVDAATDTLTATPAPEGPDTPPPRADEVEKGFPPDAPPIEAGPTRVEVGIDAPADGPSEARLEAGTEAGHAGCPSGSAVPRVLATLPGDALPSALAIIDGTAFIGTSSQLDLALAPTGALVSVSLASGAIGQFPCGNAIPEQLVAGRGTVFYTPGAVTETGPGTWRFDYNSVARFDLATGQSAIVDSSPAATTFGIFSLTGSPAGDVFWTSILDVSGSAAIRTWNATTANAETILTWGLPVPLLTDGDSIYWMETTSSLHMVIRSMPVAGGAISQIYESTTTFPDTPSLVAVDGQRLYYAFGSGPSQGLWSMPKAGGDGQVVVANAMPILLLVPATSDPFLYWVDQSDQNTIRRAHKDSSGLTEILWSGTNPTSMAADACNTYWIGGHPSQLFARAR